MKAKIVLFVLLLLLLQVYGEFYIKSLYITMKVNKDASVDVKEDIKLYVRGSESIGEYTSTLENSTLGEWQAVLGSDAVRLHVDRNVVDVEKLTVRPQPLYNYNTLKNLAEGEIIITYKAKPYKEKPNSGVFMLEEIKPRTYELKLNPKALSFKLSLNGNIIIDEKTTLEFVLPKDSLLIDVNPIPPELRDVELPARVKSVRWSNILLVSPSLVIEYKENIGEEIYQFFQDTFNAIMEFSLTKEGIITLSVVVLLFLLYAQIKAKIRKMREKHEAK